MSPNAAGPDASLQTCTIVQYSERAPFMVVVRSVDRETIERSEINGRDTSATLH